MEKNVHTLTWLIILNMLSLTTLRLFDKQL